MKNDVEKQTKWQWVAIVLGALIEVLTKLNVI